MYQLPSGAAPRVQFDAKTKLPPLPTQFRSLPGIDARLGRKVAEGLQLTRASTIALTRLQLALAGGDRRQAMAAIDRLHVLDGEIEHLVEGLPQGSASAGDEEAHSAAGALPANDGAPRGDDLLASLNKHLTDQKLALAFEKLALASGISGPDLDSAEHPLARDENGSPGRREGSLPLANRETTRDPASRTAEDAPPLVDWHAFPDVQTVVWDRIPPKVWGLVLTVLVAAALVAAVVTMTMI